MENNDQEYQPLSPEDDSYPPKPESPAPSDTIGYSIFSMLVFIVAWYFLVNKDLGYIAILVTVLLVHELGHFIAMKIFGYNELKIFFVPLFGAFASGNKTEISQKQRAIILLAGPVPGIIIGLVMYMAGLTQDNPLFTRIANTFIFVNVFNLIPISPFDGGKLIEVLFFSAREILQNVFTILSMVVISALAVYFKIYMLLIIPFFMINSLRGRSRLKKVRELLRNEGLNFNQPLEEMNNREFWLIRQHVIENSEIFRRVNGHDYRPVAQEKQIRSQMELLRENRMIFDLRIGGKLIFLLLWLLFSVGPVLYVGYYYRNDIRRQMEQQQQQDMTIQQITTTRQSA